jgi:hypothetical protein
MGRDSERGGRPSISQYWRFYVTIQTIEFEEASPSRILPLPGGPAARMAGRRGLAGCN